MYVHVYTCKNPSTSKDEQYPVKLTVDQCHPGYKLDDITQECECQDHLREIVRCDSFNRYFYAKVNPGCHKRFCMLQLKALMAPLFVMVTYCFLKSTMHVITHMRHAELLYLIPTPQDGLWVGLGEDNTAFFSTTIPGFLNCTRAGTLPGCLFKFDDRNEQCASGRKGMEPTAPRLPDWCQLWALSVGPLCGDCDQGYGVTFDLRFCKKDCGAGGIVLFIVICKYRCCIGLLWLRMIWNTVQALQLCFWHSSSSTMTSPYRMRWKASSSLPK